MDTGGDGLDDMVEVTDTTSAVDADSDGDGLNDGEEISTYRPNEYHSDGDSLGGDEVNTYSTDPNNTDSDEDGLRMMLRSSFMEPIQRIQIQMVMD